MWIGHTRETEEPECKISQIKELGRPLKGYQEPDTVLQGINMSRSLRAQARKEGGGEVGD